MGLFDLFKAGSKEKGEKKDPKAAAAAKWAERAGDKRAQNYDRQEAIAALADMKTGEAAAALLKRFTFTIDPSITDQDEKDTAFEGIVGAGELAIEPIRAFSTKAASLAWPMKILKELLPEEAFVEELLSWLSRWDTEYSKFIDPKIQLLAALEDYKHPKIREAVQPFLEDVNETARFHAVATTFAQGDEAATPSLVSLFVDEESFRIKNKLADGFAATGWPIPDDQRDSMRKALPPGYSIDAAGKVRKR
ncbi:HEAT repeat domain-containing protein [Pendulispora brunnea]|uniref:HEAT repeat domain-containing protein n=1 Tax=Pendulispora brunnea TaxID=2905690 RepID=A0ABZ2JZP7_9BACT